MPLLDPRNVVDAAQRGDVTSAQMVGQWSGFGASNAASIVRDFITPRQIHHGHAAADRRAVAESAYRFHQNAGTLTPGVLRNLESLAAGLPLIRIAYTPDHFAGLALYGETLFADQVARDYGAAGVNTAQAVVIIDTEVAADKRSHSSIVPDVKRDESLLRMSAKVPAAQRNHLSRYVDAPSEQQVLRWMDELYDSVHADIRALRRIGIVGNHLCTPYENIRRMRAEALASVPRARSLADFNMIFASRIINVAWSLPMAFVSLIDCVPFMQEYYERVLARYDDIVAASATAIDCIRRSGLYVSDAMRFDLREFPLWLICDCRSRVALTIRQGRDFEIDGRCASCTTVYRFDLGSRASPNLTRLCRRLAPRMLFDDLTEPAVWGILCGISNAGSVRHLLPMYETARLLGIPVPPEALLRLRGIYYGFAELRLAAAGRELRVGDRTALWRIYWGRASILYYLLSTGVDGLREMWHSWFAAQNSVAGVNLASLRFGLERFNRDWLESTMTAIPPR